MKHTVIIVAGGKGMRMGSEIPKQFLLIGDKPILMHTIEAFYRFDPTLQLIVVLPESEQIYWSDLCSDYSFTISHQIVSGGDTRFESVSNGLQNAVGEFIAIHDGVRPFVATEVIERCFTSVQDYGAVVPVIDSVESIRKVTSNNSVAVDRSNYKLVQTPQVFQAEILKKAYKQSYSSLFTDDASVVEAFGYKIHLVEGNRENIKVTTPFDLLISAALLR